MVKTKISRLLCLIGIHYIPKENKEMDEEYKYRLCSKCKTLFVDYKWSYILKTLFKGDKDG